MKILVAVAFSLISHCCFAKANVDVDVFHVLHEFRVGAYLKNVERFVGKNDFSEGGPDSSRSHAFEMTGPKIDAVQGDFEEQIPAFAVFEIEHVHKKYLLVHLELDVSGSQRLRSEKYFEGQGYQRIESARENVSCLISSIGEVALVTMDRYEDGRFKIVLEANSAFLKKNKMKGHWMGPNVSDYCGK